ncbi:MAG: hypothetical protein KGL39_31470 [Patescibacteria group bacterium]|nr:hypothetical protein [Patescibacteria group bacterium]
MERVKRLIKEHGAEQCGAALIVFINGRNVEIGRCDRGAWIIEPEWEEKLSSPKTKAAPKKVEEPVTTPEG